MYYNKVAHEAEALFRRDSARLRKLDSFIRTRSILDAFGEVYQIGESCRSRAHFQRPLNHEQNLSPDIHARGQRLIYIVSYSVNANFPTPSRFQARLGHSRRSAWTRSSDVSMVSTRDGKEKWGSETSRGAFFGHGCPATAS